MQRSRYRTIWCTYTIVSLGALTAINLILSVVLVSQMPFFPEHPVCCALTGS